MPCMMGSRTNKRETGNSTEHKYSCSPLPGLCRHKYLQLQTLHQEFYPFTSEIIKLYFLKLGDQINTSLKKENNYVIKQSKPCVESLGTVDVSSVICYIHLTVKSRKSGTKKWKFKDE